MKLADAVPLVDAWGMHGDVGWGWMIVMMFGMLLFWAALVVGIVWLIRGAAWSSPGRRPAQETPVEILDRRFAEGAVTPDEYRERREMLAGNAGGRSGSRG